MRLNPATRASLAVAALLSLPTAACGGGDDAEGDVPRTDGCGIADPESGEAVYCAVAGTAMCVCQTGRCARFDLSCTSSYRYTDDLAECVAMSEADSMIFSDDGADFCPLLDADADAEADADADAETDPGPDSDTPPDADAETDTPPVCGNGLPERGEECDGDAPRTCTTTCGSAGSETCGDDCRWGPCLPPAETCNGSDDDCDGLCDQTSSCCAGELGDCTTGCGSAGTRTCSATCAWEECQVPPEACNGVDDDCDTLIDDFADTFSCGDGCCNGPETYCGCPADCTTPVPAPSPPRPRWPWNGAYSGTLHASASLRPTFRWDPSTDGCGTATYEVQVDASCATDFAACPFPSPEAATSGLTTVEWRPTTALPVESAARPLGRRYYWRVRACDGAAGCSAWSAVRYLEVGRVPADFDGDGRSDLAVGTPEYGTAGGRVYVFRGAAVTGVDPAPAILPPAVGQAEARFGRHLAALDMNADGFADLAVGEPLRDVDDPDDGQVALHLGSTTGIALAPIRHWTYHPLGGGARLGSSLANAGDLNADGFADLVVGAPGIDAGSTVPDCGGAVVYLGSATIPTGESVALGPTELLRNQRYGESVGPAGDLAGDGFHAALVAAASRPGSSGQVGRVYAYLGTTTGVAGSTPVIIDPPDTGHGLFGFTLACLGDLGGDSYPDLAIGRPEAAAPVAFAGQVLVYGATAGGIPATPDTVLAGDGTPVRFGYAIAPAGAVGLTGQRGVVIGAPESDARNGRVELFAGRPLVGTTPIATFTPLAGSSGSVLGAAVAGALDLNGDGKDDVAASALASGSGTSTNGAVFVYLNPAFGAFPATPSVVVDSPSFVPIGFGQALATGY
jgi:hypothetical protein